jgi:hypothetical protein
VWSFGDRWYADLVFEAPASYSPLLQLALARYQPNSLDGLELSEVVRADFAPLLPDRTLVVGTVVPGEVQVRLSGTGPGGPTHNRVDVVLEEARPAAPGAVGVLDEAAGSGQMWVGIGSISGDLSQILVLPRPSGGGPLRVRVREVEVLPRREDVVAAVSPELAERTVFTDVVPLP